MEDEITPQKFKRLKTLYVNYYKKNYNHFTPIEYLKNLLARTEDPPPDFIIEMFLKILKHEQIYLCLLEEYTNRYKSRQFVVHSDDKTILTLIYHLLIIELNKSNLDEIQDILVKLKPTKIKNLLEFMNCEEFLILATEITCAIFNSEYTLEVVIRPLVNKMDLIDKLQRYCIAYFLKLEAEMHAPKPVTVPKSPHLSKPRPAKNIPQAETNITKSFKPNPIPKTTYAKDRAVLRKLEKDHKRNREEALKLLELARNADFHYAKQIERKGSLHEIKSKIIKAKKIPKFKPVDVKPTATVLMREAHRMTKNCEEEVKKLELMLTNSSDPSIFDNWEEEERKRLEEEHLQNIQKKHLLGLLTREEAIIAKQNLLKQNKERMIEIKLEKAQLNMELEEWKENEHKRAQELVEKQQQLQEQVKQAEKKVFEEKQLAARQVDEESKALLRQCMEEKEAELARKIEIIKDLKALESLKGLNKKDFDPTETPNLGLLCEMSIAELQERLLCLKMEVEEEQKKKKQAISDIRNQRKEMLDNAKEFIEANKEFIKIKKEKPPEKITKASDTPEIIALRKKIEEAKKMKTMNAIELKQF